MTTMNEERAGFEAVYGTIKPEDHASGDDQAVYELEWQAFKAGAAWQRAQGEVPDGYALVPVEPTPAMRVIGARDCSSLIQPDQAGEVWRAMLGAVVLPAEYAFSAAPAHPAERQEQGEVQRLRDVLDEYERQTKALPCQHEIPERGCSTYNWRMSVIRDLRAALAASTGQEVGK